MEPVQNWYDKPCGCTGSGGSGTDRFCYLVPNGSTYEGDPLFLYCSNIVSILFCLSSTTSTFPGGLHLCMSFESYNFYYRNAIFPKNQEKLETNFLCRNKGLIHCFNIVSSLFCPSSFISTLPGGLHLYKSCELDSYYYTNAIIIPGISGRARNKLYFQE